MLEKNKKSIKKLMKNIIKSLLLFIYITILGSLIAGGISAGVITLIPDEASKPCYLGYYAHCSFTPISTFILFAMAIIGIVFLMKLIRNIKRKYIKILKIESKLKASVKR